MAKKVLIIGAGLSGLAAALDLHNAGFEIQVIEARDRVGGRIAQDKSFTIPIDMGASWIHGIDNNPLYPIAKELNLKLDITHNPNLTGEGSLEIYKEDGNRVDPSIQNNIRNQMDVMIDTGRKLLESHNQDLSFEEMLNASSKFVQTKEYNAEEYHFMEWLKSGMEGWDNSNLNELSAKNHFWEHDAPIYTGGDGFICDGFFNIPRHLAKPIEHKIHLNQIVKKVIQEPTGVKVVTNKQIFSGDYVICTLPLGVLKEGAIEFSPALPPWKKTSIERIGMGLMNKIIMEFDQVFWNDKADGLGYVSSKFRGEFGFFLSLNHLVKRPVLMCFVAADFARVVETWSDEQTIERVMEILRTIFGKNRAIPDPVNYAVSRWGSDPFARGSYSYMKVHATPEHLEDIARPVGRLHFAGEATAKYPGYTHGAYTSAKREVERILKRAAVETSAEWSTGSGLPFQAPTLHAIPTSKL